MKRNSWGIGLLLVLALALGGWGKDAAEQTPEQPPEEMAALAEKMILNGVKVLT